MSEKNGYLQVKPSRVLHKMRQGGIACCAKINVSGTRATEIAAMQGFDCIWTDMEHVPNDWSTIENQIMVCKLYGTDIIVRVARGSYSDYVKPLEADASGIMIPHIMSLQDAQDVVRRTRFYPTGLRPVDGGNADGKYCLLDYHEYVSQSNREKMTMLQIEDPEPLADLDAICALPGYDMIFFGPGDFSQAIGYPGQITHPEVVRIRKLIGETARHHGKFAGTVGVGNIAEIIDEGYQFINIGSDVFALGQYYRDRIREFEAILGQRQ